MLLISKTDHCAHRSIQAQLNEYQEYLVTFKLMTAQVVKKARPLGASKCALALKGLINLEWKKN